MLCALLYRSRGFSLSSIKDYKLIGGRITPLDLSVIVYLPLLALWAYSIYPTAAKEYGLGYLGLAIIPAMACMLLFTKRLWLLSARYGSIDSLLIVYFQSPQVQRLFTLINLSFSIIFMMAQAKAAGIFLHVFTNTALPVWFGITLALIFPSLYLFWGGVKGLLLAYKVQLGIIIFGTTALILILLTHFFGLDEEGTAKLLNNKIGVNSFVPLNAAVSPVAWNSLNFISFSILFLALPCLSSMMNFIGASKVTPSIKSLIVTWSSIGLLLAIFLPIIFLATQALDLDNIRGNILANSLDQSQPNQGILSIFYPSFTAADKSLPTLLLFLTEYKWLVAIIGVVIFSSLQLLGAVYLAHSTATVNKHILEPFGLPAKKSLITTLGLVTFVVWLLSFMINLPLLNLYVLALALICQALPAIIGLTYWPFLTRSGVNLGLLCGCLVVIFTEPTILSQFGYGLFSQFNIHSVLLGLAANFIVAIVLSMITTDTAAIRNKQKFHNFLRGYAGLPRDKRQLKAPAWLASILWLMLAFSSVTLMSGYDFGFLTAEFMTLLIWLWQILCWCLGIFLLWFLGQFMELADCPYNAEQVAINKLSSSQNNTI